MKIYFTLIAFILLFSMSFAREKKNSTIQREPTGLFDCQFNTKSNFQFPVTNYGISFLNFPLNQGGGFWPRGSLNEYLFGSGFWFGTQKFIIADSVKRDNNGNIIDTVYYRKLNKYCSITYNPNSGLSWFVPGRIEDGDLIDESDINKYRVYFSTDMNSDGRPVNPNDGPNWPVWKSDEQSDNNFGSFIYDISDRSRNFYPMGPAFISDEDIFSTFKDTDLNQYEGGIQFRQNMGYPLGLQLEQTIFSWENDEFKDMIIIYYKLINFSSDTLLYCWLAPIFDSELATSPNNVYGAANDFARFYDEDASLNLSITWTNTNRGEIDMGYLGISMIKTPSVFVCNRSFDTLIDYEYQEYCAMCIERDTISIPDIKNPGSYKDTIICLKEIYFPSSQINFPRPDEVNYPVEQQLGLKTFRRWTINYDLDIDESRYNFVSGTFIEIGEGEPADYRMLFSTGPFNLLPGQSVSCAVQINFAMPSLGGDATGEKEDLTGLVEKVKLGQDFFYNEIISKIEEQEKQLISSILIYPNPASTQIFIKHGINGDFKLRIYDILGRDVTNNISLNNSNEILELNIENLKTGHYIICLSNNRSVHTGTISVIR